ncbi:MAG: translation initiation factor IF-2 [Bacteroidales bacterium]|jgi:translation initiation factor IF-2
MSEAIKVVRLSKAAREFNISIDSVIEFLGKKGFVIDRNPNTKLEPQMYDLLFNEFQEEKHVKEVSKQKGLEFIGKQSITIENQAAKEEKRQEELPMEDEVIIKNTGVEYFKKSLKNIPSTAAERIASKETTTKPVQEPVVEKKATETVKAAETAPDVKSPVVTEQKKEEVKPAEVKQEKADEVVENKPEVIVEETAAKPVEKTKAEAPVATPEIQEDNTPVQTPPLAESAAPEQVADEEPIVQQNEETPEIQAEPFDDEESEEVVEDQKGSLKVYGKIDLDSLNQKTRPKKKTKAEKKKEASDKQKAVESVRQKDKQADKTAERVEPKKPVEEPKRTFEKPAPDVEPAKPVETPKAEPVEEANKQPDNFLKTKFEKLAGPVIFGKIDLPVEIKRKKGTPVASSSDDSAAKKKKRKRIKVKPAENQPRTERPKELPGKKKFTPPVKKPLVKTEPTDEEIQKKIKDTLARLAPLGKSKAAKHRKQKREHVSHNLAEEMQRQEDEKSILKVTEFLTANELANMMNVGVTQIITTCMQLGMFVSINQRLDAETIALVAEEFGFKIEFVGVDDSDNIDLQDVPDDPAQMVERAPIVTVMGHVDHGKTKLLDYIRKANVVAGEAGGITQHIGAYEVTTDSGKKVTFLDTPGHEAFTAMRARGAKVTDIAIIVIAADDSVMPQTREAINHAQAAGVKLVFAFNKMDKPGANSEKIKEQLANMNILVEDWGGKYQSQEISAITGMGVADLLEKVLLESEMLQLQANPNKLGRGTVIEASLDKGRGFVATVLVQDGTMSKGDILLAGPVYGKVKAMFNERNKSIKSAGPSTPVLLLGLSSAPQAGDVFNVMSDEKEAKNVASKRQQLMREQSLRTQKHITLDEIGRRIAIGDFKELNIIVKGDVDGSVEALSDQLLKLSTREVQVNVIHKAVGAITESDVMLASASDAIIIGFQVRPSSQARKLAEKEEIDIRLYSIIYQATEELKTAIEGMLSPKMEEKITCNVEVRDVFRITKVGTIAGCMVLDGKITRHTKVRVIRDGIVIYTGQLGSLKRFKDDVKEVATNYECGLNIDNFNDIKIGDIIEGYMIVEVAR